MIGDNIAIESSGDPEKDREIIEAFIKHRERMEDGVCPNGCARLVRIDDHTRECPVCHFHGWQNTPLPPEDPEGDL